MVENIDCLFNLYIEYGNEDYIGENVSQIEHALQCANSAEKEGYPIRVILAAFLHDIGHLLGLKLNKPQMKTSGIVYGVKDHEKLGADYLRSLGVSETICFLVENHVFGKRYLVYKDKSYYDLLSDASKQTLKFQGGPLTEQEAKEFENHEFFEEIVKMRLWDDQAKDDQLNLAVNKNVIEQYLQKYKSALSEMISSN